MTNIILNESGVQNTTYIIHRNKQCFSGICTQKQALGALYVIVCLGDIFYMNASIWTNNFFREVEIDFILFIFLESLELESCYGTHFDWDYPFFHTVLLISGTVFFLQIYRVSSLFLSGRRKEAVLDICVLNMPGCWKTLPFFLSNGNR